MNRLRLFSLLLPAIWAFDLLPRLQAQSDLFSMTELGAISVPGGVTALQFDAQGRLWIGGRDGVYRLSRLDGAPDALSGRPTAVLAASRDGNSVIAAAQNGQVHGVSNGQSYGWASPIRPPVLALTASGDVAAGAGPNNSVVLLRPSTGDVMKRIQAGTRRPIRWLAFSPNGLRLFGLSEDRFWMEWDTQTSRLIRKIEEPDGTVHSAALNSGGTWLALGTEFSAMAKGSLMSTAHPSHFHRESRIRIYDVAQGQLAKQIDAVAGQPVALAFSADSRFLAVIRRRPRASNVAVYDLQRGVEVATAPASETSSAIAFDHEGKYLTWTRPDERLAIAEIRGVFRGADPGDLTGVKVRITSRDNSPLIFPREKTVLAILNLDAIGVPNEIALTLSEMIRNRVSGTPNVDLVERERMERILKEQDFQLSERSDAATAIRLGRVLNAQKALFGSVSRLGTSYLISVSLVDVETARTDGIREVLCQRCSLDDLPEVVAILRPALAGTPK